MQLGIVGLGRIGGNLARQAVEKGYEVVGYRRDPVAREALAREGVKAVGSLAELAAALIPPRVVFLYVPHGDAVERTGQELRSLLGAGDVVVDGGNSHWRDSVRRHAFFAESGIHFLDMGTSGGIAGARRGACFMVGGDRSAFDMIAPILRDLSAGGKGYVFVGGPGSGHFTKLIHNAIEFGMVQAIAEGVELLERSEYAVDLPALIGTWGHGSVIRGWLLELMGKALPQSEGWDGLSSYVEDTGEVKWVLEYALGRDIPTPVATISQTMLMEHRDVHSISAKAVALLRNQFGGHPVHRAAPSKPEP